MFLQSRANQRRCPLDTNRSMELDASSGAQQFRGYTFHIITDILEITVQEVAILLTIESFFSTYYLLLSFHCYHICCSIYSISPVLTDFLL
jgi:heme/copper-type cytochrome/quinol oxidase subunit 3